MFRSHHHVGEDPPSSCRNQRACDAGSALCASLAPPRRRRKGRGAISGPLLSLQPTCLATYACTHSIADSIPLSDGKFSTGTRCVTLVKFPDALLGGISEKLGCRIRTDEENGAGKFLDSTDSIHISYRLYRRHAQYREICFFQVSGYPDIFDVINGKYGLTRLHNIARQAPSAWKRRRS